MDVWEAIIKRRSVRVFKPEKISKSLVSRVVEAATYAPSACNVQGWKFIVIDKPELMQQIVDRGGSIIIKQAPVGILVLYDNQTKYIEYRDDIQSAAGAVQNLQLAAWSLGLGSCCICHLPGESDLRRLLKIPSNYSPVSYIILGYPVDIPKDVPRKYKTIEEVLNFNVFSSKWSTKKDSNLLLMVQRLAVWIYQMTPLFIKKSFLNDFLDRHLVKKFEN